MKCHNNFFLEKLTPTSISVDLFTAFVTKHQKSVGFVFRPTNQTLATLDKQSY